MQKWSLLAITLLALGCSSQTLLYGNDSCGEGRAAYVSANGRAATCLPEDQTAFILCARELSLSESNTTSNRTVEAQVGITVVEAEGGAAAAVNLQEALTQKWSAEGELAKARAAAVDACVGLLDKPPGK